ncbi:MAG TPA: polymer-forming cytoskeletal protein [Rhabdochlamydiaceae bacterium]|jgi:cytoskeletal protein CcmA (bactofilin family)
MFRKFKSPFERMELSSLSQEREERPQNPFGTDFACALPAPELQSEEEEYEEPETVIAPNVEIKGVLRFQKLLRIDGTFEGELHSTGKLIIGPTGCVSAHIDLEEAFVSGKVTGNITVKKRLVLRGNAEVTGDITAPLLSVDEGVSIVGILNVVPSTEAADPAPLSHT